MHVVVLAHGDTGGRPWLRARLAAADLVIAADGGAQAACDAGRVPDTVVGDFDSLDPATRAGLESAGSELLQYPRDKDETDLELALSLAVERGATSIQVLGAFGGPRLDHALANVLLLTLPMLAGHAVTLVDPRHEARLLRGPQEIELAGAPGDVVTLLPLTATATGVDTVGLRYPLRNGTLELGRSRGVSNELRGDCGAVRLADGLLLVVLHRVSHG